MNILALADEPSPYYYEYFKPKCLQDVDMIISCGDLPPEYLEFLVTMGSCPLFYVHGNHDEKYLTHPPGGCVCLDDKITVYKGIRILGLGGSYRYRNGEFMFTEREMMGRVLRVLPQIIRHRGFDILVTHAPARNINDFDTPTHRGFYSFRWLMDMFHPRYFLHGHIHLSYSLYLPRWCRRNNTQIINAFEAYAFEYEKKS